MKAFSFQITVLLCLYCAFNATASVLYADVNGANPTPPYADWSTAATNIQDAVNAGGLGDTVLVTNGVYQYGGAAHVGQTQSNRVYVPFGSGLNIQSVNGPSVTVIKGYQVPGTTNGVNAARCVYLTEFSGLYGFTLTGGATQSGGYGGGVLAESSCVVSNCIITGNSAAYYGGGSYAGALINCVIAQNVAVNGGGGAYGSVLNNCIVTNNDALNGGGVAECSLNNCLLAGNGDTNQTQGGAAYLGTLNNCTLVGNSSRILGAADGSTLINSIIYYNHTGSYSDCYQCQLTNCCTTIGNGNSGLPNDSISNAPAFVDLVHGNFRLQIGSPCINTGTNYFVSSATDLDGNPRIVGGTVDMGAYENQYAGLVHYVSLTSTNPIAPYANWPTAATNIQDAIGVAGQGDVVAANAGVYNAGVVVTSSLETNRAAVTNGVALLGVYGASSTLIVGGTQIRCAYVGSNSVLNGFTLFKGNGDAGGGAWCESTNSLLVNCLIISNLAVRGGGDYSGTLSNCTLSGNVAIFPPAASAPGGGAYGGVLHNCTLTGNSANYGGAANDCQLDGCLIESNAATFGGGVMNSSLTNCTLIANTAAIGGGAYASTLENCIVYYNTSVAVPAAEQNFFGDALDYCCTWPLPTNGVGNITNAPLLVNLAANDFHLQSNSPCINSGNNSDVVSATDFDGNPRIAGGTVDIGAYEFQTPASIISYDWLQQYGLPTDGSADFVDTDGDGMNNWQEWIAGTNPTNALSVLAMLAPSGSPSGVVVSWQSVSNRTYSLLRSSDLGAQPAFSIIQTNIAGLAGTTTFTDMTATNSSWYFYRVGVP